MSGLRKNILESEMAGNLYNKTDAEQWMVTPKLPKVRQTSFLDVNNLVLYDDDQLGDFKHDEEDIINIRDTFGVNK